MTQNARDIDGPITQVLPPEPSRPPETAVRSIYESSYLEALRHKWIASEKAGRDLGESAISQWLDHHWKGWCRERWLEHLRGQICWAEFDRREFCALRDNFHGDRALLEKVLEKVRAGYENLDIILWASDLRLDIRQVIDILVIADINRPVLDKRRFFEDNVL